MKPIDAMAVHAKKWGAYLFVLAIVLLQYRSWYVGHASNMEYLTTAMDGVLQGTPHWRAYQNRLLSPLLYAALDHVTGMGYVLFVQLALLALGISLYSMLEHTGVDSIGGVIAVCFSALLWVLEHHNSFYLWDLIDACWMLTLFYCALSSKLEKSIYFLFSIALLNRESAIFVALAWLISGIVLLAQGDPQGRKRLKGGLLMGLLALAFVEIVRKTMFHHSMLEGVWLDDAHKNFENHVLIFENAKYMVAQVRAASPFVFIMMVYAAVLISGIKKGFVSKNPDVIGAAVALFIYFLSLFVFGVASELRLYQPFVWVLALILFATCTKEKVATAIT